MTYFGVLLTFIVPPLLALLVLVPRDVWRAALGRGGPVNWLPYGAVLLHVFIAVAYTTPWDNYLVATDVWWYDPDLVTGIRLGYVPIEEYTFFVVQTLLTGLWTVGLMRDVFTSPPAVRESVRGRCAATVVAGIAWVAALVLLVAGWQPGRYLALILGWALPPLMLQLLFGADILLANWRLLAAAIIPPTAYLWLVDALAITDGTWTINPAATTGLKLGPLPVEEMAFFLVTNIMIVSGITLLLAEASQGRLSEVREWLRRRRAGHRGALETAPVEEPAHPRGERAS